MIYTFTQNSLTTSHVVNIKSLQIMIILIVQLFKLRLEVLDGLLKEIQLETSMNPTNAENWII